MPEKQPLICSFGFNLSIGVDGIMSHVFMTHIFFPKAELL